MASLAQKYLPQLQQVCNLPTAPYAEQHVSAYLRAWAQASHRRQHLRVTSDPAGNVYLHYRRGPAPRTPAGKLLPPLLIEAHMDHPGFVLTHLTPAGHLHAEFRGGVKPSHFASASVGFWQPDPPHPTPASPPIKPNPQPRGHWVPAKVLEAQNVKSDQGDHIAVTLELLAPFPAPALPPGTLGMWLLPDAAILPDSHDELFSARVCDDLAGIAAALCLLDELIAQDIVARLTLLCTRAEEVGFAGVIAAARQGWIAKRSVIIGLETSKASHPGQDGAAQGAGPVVRVADKSGVFSAGLTHFLCQAAAGIADQDPDFRWQRKLMDAGTCSTTAFIAYGYESASLTLPLGNYHNMSIPGDIGGPPPPPLVPSAGPGIASETIHLADFAGMVRILVAAVQKYPSYQSGFGVMKQRLEKLHTSEHLPRLYNPTPPDFLG